MKRFLIGIAVGLIIGWVSPFGHAEDDNLKYKQYLGKMVVIMEDMNDHLAQIELNTKAVRDKLHA